MTAFWILLGFLLTWLLLTAAGVAVFARHLERRNRVAPDVPSLAPMVWLISPSRPAVMHRRLRDSVTRVEVAALQRRPTGATEGLTTELVDQAVELDRHVVHATHQRRPQRRLALRAIDQQVVQLDVLSHRLVALTLSDDPVHRLTRPAPPEALADLAQRLDMIEEAHAEIAHLERASGLLDLDAVAADLATRAAAGDAPAPRSSPASDPAPRSAPGPAATDQPPPPPPGSRPVPLPPPSSHDQIPPMPPRPAAAPAPAPGRTTPPTP
ncbi:MAG: hypothetical protein U0Q07_08420 [Acidimicrobiales bacterium]